MMDKTPGGREGEGIPERQEKVNRASNGKDKSRKPFL